jgi:hypothetical protein
MSTPVYKHTQIGYVTGGALATAAVFAALKDRPRSWVHSLLAGGLALGATLFSSLTVVVDEEALRFSFGPGVWERRIPLDDVQRVVPVRNSPLYGWGIHYTPHGWLYNVSGLDAVEIQTSTETLRLGTDEPTQLVRALKHAQPALRDT